MIPVPAEPSPGESFYETVKRLLTIFVPKDRIRNVLVRFDDRIAIAPFVQPVIFPDESGVPRMPVERSAGGQDRLVLAVDSAVLGKDPLSFVRDAALAPVQGTGPYNQTAGGSYIWSNLKSKTVYADSDAGGNVAATDLLAAGVAGVKHVIVEIQCMGFVIATMAAAKALLSLSDTPSDNNTIVVGPNSNTLYGPFKQNTAATAQQVSGGAGSSTALSRFVFTVRYWDGV